MAWAVLLHDDFELEFTELEALTRRELLATLRVLESEGPQLGRPHVDTLKGSAHANMKELRFRASGGVWRVAFAFDADRQAIVLVAGDKGGVNQQRFYRDLIRKADLRFTGWLLRRRKA